LKPYKRAAVALILAIFCVTIFALISGKRQNYLPRTGDARRIIEPVQTVSEIPDEKLSTALSKSQNNTRHEDASSILAAEDLFGTTILSVAGGKLSLTPDQQRILSLDFVTYMHVKAEIEKRLVNVTGFDGSTLSVTIPPYPEEGGVLRSAFYKRLANDFPPDQAQAIVSVIGSTATGFFRGFGQMAQSFQVTRADSDGETVTINWSATVPDGQEPVGATVMSGSLSRVPINSLATGEYEALQQAVIQHFH
jgi:hypothetical protein